MAHVNPTSATIHGEGAKRELPSLQLCHESKTAQSIYIYIYGTCLILASRLGYVLLLPIHATRYKENAKMNKNPARQELNLGLRHHC